MKVTDKIKELRLKGVDFEDMAELDKRFKDVEELKRKIRTLLIDFQYDFKEATPNLDGAWFLSIKLSAKILKLLEE